MEKEENAIKNPTDHDSVEKGKSLYPAACHQSEERETDKVKSKRCSVNRKIEEYYLEDDIIEVEGDSGNK